MQLTSSPFSPIFLYFLLPSFLPSFLHSFLLPSLYAHQSSFHHVNTLICIIIFLYTTTTTTTTTSSSSSSQPPPPPLLPRALRLVKRIWGMGTLLCLDFHHSGSNYSNKRISLSLAYIYCDATLTRLSTLLGKNVTRTQNK